METFITYIAMGGSMTPTIIAGDKVTVKTGKNKYHVNDIVLFRQGEVLIMHRIVCIFSCAYNEYCITKGDSINIDDDPILLSSLIGKVINIKHA